MAISFGLAAVAPKVTRKSAWSGSSRRALRTSAKLPGQFGIDVLVVEEEGDRLLLVFIDLDADADVTGDLCLAERLGDPGEFGIRGPELAARDRTVPDAVDRIDREIEHEVGRVARLEQEQHGARVDRDW